jgi:tripartite-type tricarboxylate transporter receptor subunit TctC
MRRGRHGVRALLLAWLVAGVPLAIAQSPPARYPVKPVRMIVPFTAGSPIEVPARAVGQRLAEALGQPFVIENRPGASGTIGTELVVKAPRDGYTLLFTNCAHSANPSLLKKLPYDSLADLAPITQTNSTYGNILVVHPSVPVRSVKEFIALARAVPGKLHYASAGVGSPPHVNGALFAAEAGIKLTHVPYKGTSVAFTDVLSGYIEVMFASSTFALPYIQAGRVRALGIGGPQRLPALPDLPTIGEAGLPGFELTCYHGMWFPAGVPAELARRLQAEVARALAAPEVRKHFADNALVPVGSTPEEFYEFLRKDIARYAEIARRIGLEPQ